jgi:hypothetical protein
LLFAQQEHAGRMTRDGGLRTGGAVHDIGLLR